MGQNWEADPTGSLMRPLYVPKAPADTTSHAAVQNHSLHSLLSVFQLSPKPKVWPEMVFVDNAIHILHAIEKMNGEPVCIKPSSDSTDYIHDDI